MSKRSGGKRRTARNWASQSTQELVTRSDSMLSQADLRHIITFDAFDLLPPERKDELLALLPWVDKQDVESVRRMFKNTYFKEALAEFQAELMSGTFDPDHAMSLERRKTPRSSRSRRNAQPDTTWKQQAYERYWGEGLSVEAVRPKEEEPPPAFSFVQYEREHGPLPNALRDTIGTKHSAKRAATAKHRSNSDVQDAASFEPSPAVIRATTTTQNTALPEKPKRVVVPASCPVCGLHMSSAYNVTRHYRVVHPAAWRVVQLLGEEGVAAADQWEGAHHLFDVEHEATKEEAQDELLQLCRSLMRDNWKEKQAQENGEAAEVKKQQEEEAAEAAQKEEVDEQKNSGAIEEEQVPLPAADDKTEDATPSKGKKRKKKKKEQEEKTSGSAEPGRAEELEVAELEPLIAGISSADTPVKRARVAVSTMTPPPPPSMSKPQAIPQEAKSPVDIALLVTNYEAETKPQESADASRNAISISNIVLPEGAAIGDTQVAFKDIDAVQPHKEVVLDDNNRIQDGTVLTFAQTENIAAPPNE